MFHIRFFLALIIMSLVFTLAIPPTAHSQNVFTEDFSTTNDMDPEFTTAVWDTDAGELTVNPFTMDLVGSYQLSGTGRCGSG